jgi:hypothetical protein
MWSSLPPDGGSALRFSTTALRARSGETAVCGSTDISCRHRSPNLGFIGYASSTACQLTSEVGAHWLSQCFRGELHLPSAADMSREVARVLEWAGAVFPARSNGYFVGPYVSHYLDELLRDMKLPSKQAGNVFAEYLNPLYRIDIEPCPSSDDSDAQGDARDIPNRAVRNQRVKTSDSVVC